MVVPVEGSKVVQKGDPVNVWRDQVELVDELERMRGRGPPIVGVVGSVLVSKSTTAKEVLGAVMVAGFGIQGVADVVVGVGGGQDVVGGVVQGFIAAEIERKQG